MRASTSNSQVEIEAEVTWEGWLIEVRTTPARFGLALWGARNSSSSPRPVIRCQADGGRRERESGSPLPHER